MDQRYRLIGNENQLFKARRITFREGMTEGVRAIELLNSDGLYVTCIEDQCLNLYDFSYKGINCAFQSKTGLVSNCYFNGGCGEFRYYWPAGIFHTCGLTNTGASAVENDMYYAEHGRIGMMRAENVNIQHTEDAVVITGAVSDKILCGHNLKLFRTITFPKQGKEIRIRDEVTNCEGTATELMLLYHSNVGYPLLTPGTRMVCSSRKVINNIGDSAVPSNYLSTEEPRDDKIEEVYAHYEMDCADGYGRAAIINDGLSLGFYVKQKTDTLPYLLQWKNMCAHDYVVGLEPSNCFARGRDAERKNGSLPVIGPYETQVFELSIGILDGVDEIRKFEKACM